MQPLKEQCEMSDFDRSLIPIIALIKFLVWHFPAVVWVSKQKKIKPKRTELSLPKLQHNLTQLAQRRNK